MRKFYELDSVRKGITDDSDNWNEKGNDIDDNDKHYQGPFYRGSQWWGRRIIDWLCHKQQQCQRQKSQWYQRPPKPDLICSASWWDIHMGLALSERPEPPRGACWEKDNPIKMSKFIKCIETWILRLGIILFEKETNPRRKKILGRQLSSARGYFTAMKR